MPREIMELDEVWEMVGNGHGVYDVGVIERACARLSGIFGKSLPLEELPIRPMKTDKTARNPKYWRIMSPDSEGIWGMDSEELGPWLCNQLDLKFEWFEGRGFQARECVRVLQEALDD